MSNTRAEKEGKKVLVMIIAQMKAAERLLSTFLTRCILLLIRFILYNEEETKQH